MREDLRIERFSEFRYYGDKYFCKICYLTFIIRCCDSTVVQTSNVHFMTLAFVVVSVQ